MPTSRAAVVLGFLLGSSAAAQAGTINDPACKPSFAHPYPVVLVHGRSGHFTDMRAIADALMADGTCVFGADYGLYDGQTGLDHLSVSGGQLRDFVQQVLATTGAKRVDAIGYSEGTGVVQDFILGKGGAASVHRVVSFGGLQHPYAHVGAPGFADSDLYLPNLILTARKVNPNITAQEVITNAITLYAGVGGQIAGVDRAVAESPFASDLFDPAYWTSLQGSLSEPDGVYIRALTQGHSLATKDRGIGVCYTNIVSLADPITGASAGFQDPGDGIENYVLVSNADHGAIINDPTAIAKMLAGLGAPCAVGTGDTTGDGSGDGSGSGADDGGGYGAGCSATSGSASVLVVLLALGLWSVVTMRGGKRVARRVRVR
jgi:hypothetical protein